MNKILITATILLLPLAVFPASPAPSPYTNLFADDGQKLSQEIRRRSATSVLESGTKIGAKLGFNYVFNENPTIVGSIFADVPLAKKFAVGLEITPMQVFPTNWVTSSLTNAISNTNLIGNGVLDYLVVTGTFKFFIDSFWIAPGLSYYHFLKGYMVVNQSEGKTYKDDYFVVKNITDDLYLITSFGYMAEIRENVFLMPELYGAFRLTGTPFSRIMLNVNFSLGFRL